MCETRPSADAPHSMASAASSTFAMQQIFTLGVEVGLIPSPPCSSVSSVVEIFLRLRDAHKYQGRGSQSSLFAVGNPDVLDLCGVLQEPAALGNFRIEPVDGAALVGENLLQVAHRHCLGGCGAGFIGE